MDIFRPIEILADAITYRWFSISNQYLVEALNFFIYDLIKIGLLLIAINYIMAITRYYLPLERIRYILSRQKWYGLDYLLAALLGVITPFCSCSSIPLFIGFIGAGIPLGVTFTFLIASPLVSEASLFIFPSVFGVKITIIYNLIGVIIAILAGRIIEGLKMDKNVNPEFLQIKTRQENIAENGGKKIKLLKKLKIWWQDAISISLTIFPYVLAGLTLGALIHGFVPKEFIENNLAISSWWSVPVAVILGIPLYANSVSVIPVIEAMAGKGIPLGTVLAFMTATVTLSIPSLLILKKVMNWKLLSAFIAVCLVGIVIIGYFFNFFSFAL